MKTRRLLSFVLAVVFLLSAAATPAFAAARTDPLSETASVSADENDIISVRIKAAGDLTYGSDYQLMVQTTPADAQYIGVVMGVGGEAKGYVTLVLSDKIRTLLKMIPLPKKMSATPDQEEEFNVYSYLKQLIDGNDVSVLLRIGDEAVSVMNILHFYVPTIDKVANSMKLALELIRKYLPESAFTNIYLDEQPFDSGSYIAGAVALEEGDMNSAGVAAFKIKPKKNADRAAVLVSDGQNVEKAKITYTYKKKGFLFDQTCDGLPTEPGTYTEIAEVGGNYSCGSISRTFTIYR